MQASLTEEGHLECEQHQIMGWGPRLNEEGKRGFGEMVYQIKHFPCRHKGMSLEPQNPREESCNRQKICIPMFLQGDAKQRQEHLNDGQETLTNSTGSKDQYQKLSFDHTHIQMYRQIKTYHIKREEGESQLSTGDHLYVSWSAPWPKLLLPSCFPERMIYIPLNWESK